MKENEREKAKKIVEKVLSILNIVFYVVAEFLKRLWEVVLKHKLIVGIPLFIILVFLSYLLYADYKQAQEVERRNKCVYLARKECGLDSLDGRLRLTKGNLTNIERWCYEREASQCSGK